jgi:SprT protein
MNLAIKKWPGLTKCMPEVLFDLKGIRAGTANAIKWQIRINPVLLNENTEDMISQTIGHEVAHLVAFCLWPPVRGRHNEHSRPHGIYWQSVMMEFGLEPKRTHAFDVANSRCYTKKTYEYSCACREKIILGSVRHNRINKGYVYLCGKCGTKIEYKKRFNF